MVLYASLTVWLGRAMCSWYCASLAKHAEHSLHSVFVVAVVFLALIWKACCWLTYVLTTGLVTDVSGGGGTSSGSTIIQSVQTGQCLYGSIDFHCHSHSTQIKMTGSYKQKQKLTVINDSIPADTTVPSNGITMSLCTTTTTTTTTTSVVVGVVVLLLL